MALDFLPKQKGEIMKSATVLYIGRFQPLHKGHVYALKKLFQKYRKVIIMVGSTNKKDEKNPFCFGERKSMINAALKEFGHRYRIIGMPDTDNDERWKNAVIKKARFDAVVTGNQWTTRCFAGYKVIRPEMLNPRKYSATKIRKLMKEKKNWQSLVPKDVVKIVMRN